MTQAPVSLKRLLLSKCSARESGKFGDKLPLQIIRPQRRFRRPGAEGCLVAAFVVEFVVSN
jgi:hypothetical protein